MKTDIEILAEVTGYSVNTVTEYITPIITANEALEAMRIAVEQANGQNEEDVDKWDDYEEKPECGVCPECEGENWNHYPNCPNDDSPMGLLRRDGYC